MKSNVAISVDCRFRMPLQRLLHTYGEWEADQLPSTCWAGVCSRSRISTFKNANKTGIETAHH